MRIAELLAKKTKRDILAIAPDRSLLDLARSLYNNGVGALLVVDDNRKLAGIVSERDIVKRLATSTEPMNSCPVASIMTRSVISCSPEDSVVATLAVMNKRKIRHIPVLVYGEPLAMLSIREFDIACRHLEALSHTDELTGLPNRRYFLGALETETARHRQTGQPMCIAMLDLDHFKQINDSFGHDTGDQVLRQLAEILKGRLRGYDVAGRIGGEEFGLLFPNTTLAAAVTVCENLGDAIRRCRVTTSTGSLSFTGSFGLTVFNCHDDEPDELMIEADRHLYRAKSEGRDRVASRLDQNVAPLQPSELDLGSINQFSQINSAE